MHGFTRIHAPRNGILTGNVDKPFVEHGRGGFARKHAKKARERAIWFVRNGNCRLAPTGLARHLGCIKTASVQQVPQQWPEILRWVAAGEEVQVTQHDKVVARVVPAAAAAQPDFLARAKAIWGDPPPGKPLSEVVAETRGGES